MQLPLIILLIIIIAFAGLFGLSFVYTPEPTQSETLTPVTIQSGTNPQLTIQPVEYP